MDITNARGTNRTIYSRALSRTPIHVRIRPKRTTLRHTLSLKEKVVLITEVDTTIAGMHRLHWDGKDSETEVKHIRTGAYNHTGVKFDKVKQEEGQHSARLMLPHLGKPDFKETDNIEMQLLHSTRFPQSCIFPHGITVHAHILGRQCH